MLQENVKKFEDKSKVLHDFDLKGSVINREVFGTITASTCLKDLNFLKLKKNFELKNKDGKFIDIPNHILRKIRRSLVFDVNFLASVGLMDYSLLLVIEDRVQKLERSRSVNNRDSFLGAEERSASSFSKQH